MNTFALFFVAMAGYVTCKPAIVRQEEILLTGMERISKRSALADPLPLADALPLVDPLPLVEEYSPEEALSKNPPRFKKWFHTDQELLEPAASTAFSRPRFPRSRRDVDGDDGDDLETAESNVFMPLFYFRRQNSNKQRYFRRRFY